MKLFRLLDRFWSMPHDIVPRRRPRHRPALVASGLTDADRRRNKQYAEVSPLLRAWAKADSERHQGATETWSPTAELERAEAEREPEEMLAEAAEREADELVRHLADLDRSAEEETAAEFADRLNPTLAPLFAAVEDACRSVLAELGIGDIDAFLDSKRGNTGELLAVAA